MDENPYRSPEAPIVAEAVGVLSGSREDLRLVAKYQRGVLLCILVYIIAAIASQLIKNELLYVIGAVALVAAIAGLVFAIMLATKVYDSMVTIVFLAIMLLLPCLGLIALLVVNQKATTVLRQNKIKVGFLGADPNSI